jgi:hypothetical protein
MKPSIEDQLRDAGREVEVAVELPAGLLERIARRRRRRRTVARCAGVGAVVVAVGAVSFAAFDRPSHQVQQLAIGANATHRATHRVMHRAKPKRLVTPTFGPTPTVGGTSPASTGSPPPTGGAPSDFFGAVGAGDERLAVIDSSTGAIMRYLQPHGSQALSTFNAARTVAYQPSLSVAQCDSSWTATNLKTGAQSPAFTALNHPAEVALSADGQQIAYVSVGAQQTVTNPNGTTMPAGCPTALETLVITNQSTGTTVQLPLGHFGHGSLDPAFDSSGELLAVKWHGRIRVLDVAHDTSMTQAEVLPSQAGCDQIQPMFRPGGDELLVAEDCLTSAAIDGYQIGASDSWALTYHHVVAHQKDSFVASYAYDPTGQHLIYSVDVGDSGPQGAVYVVQSGADRHVLDGVYQVAW